MIVIVAFRMRINVVYAKSCTVEPRYTEMRYTEYLLYRSNRLSPLFPIFKFDRYNEF